MWICACAVIFRASKNGGKNTDDVCKHKQCLCCKFVTARCLHKHCIMRNKQRRNEEIMPFINSKVSVAMSKEKKDAVKAKLGEAISLIPGKSENWLMVGFEDSYDLYFQGNQDGETAFVEVKVFGSASPDVFSKMTGAICDIYQEELGIPQNRIYVKYEEVENWGWNGSNF